MASSGRVRTAAAATTGRRRPPTPLGHDDNRTGDVTPHEIHGVAPS
ncbi:hypothetical protein [Kitasatospora sp. NPDC001547]